MEEEQKLTKAQATLLEKRNRRKAAETIALRVQHYAPMLGVHPGKISIRDQKTRWGSCSSSGTLSFNWRLILAPPQVLDYVVVHELSHMRQMNHSKAFWSTVESIMPDYKQWDQWLKDHGKELKLS